MKSPEKIFEEAEEKLLSIANNLRACMHKEDLERARVEAYKLTEYHQCAYCQGYRRTMEKMGCNGVCGNCPLHRHGEELTRTRISYNGCYKIGVYRAMVKAATWFDIDCSMNVLAKLINCVEESLKYLKLIRCKLIPNSVTLSTGPPRLED